jgi:hypothetical protein
MTKDGLWEMYIRAYIRRQGWNAIVMEKFRRLAEVDTAAAAGRHRAQPVVVH